MAKRKKKPSKKLVAARVIVIVILVLLAAFIVSYLIWDHLNPIEDSGSANVNQVESGELVIETEKPKSTEEFDDGQLKLIGAIEYEGPNFDSEMETGIWTALQIQNISGKFLRHAQIEVQISKSEILILEIDSLPAGETAVVIGKGYEGYQEENYYEVISCQSSYEETVVSEIEGLSIMFDSGKIVLENQSAKDIDGFTCYYKGKAGDILMGGIVYNFVVDLLPSGQTYEVDCQSLFADSILIVEIN